MTDRNATDTLTLAAASDERYAIGLAVCLHSVLTTAAPGYRVDVHILDGGMTPDTRRRIGRVVDAARPTTRVNWHRPEIGGLSDLPTSAWGSHTNYLRLLIPEIVGPDVSRVVYLDSDMLVRDDIAALWDMGLGRDDSPVLAVTDNRAVLGASFGASVARSIGLDPESPYFNSGLLVMNLERWRSDRVSERAFAFAREHGALQRYSDQDALNAVLGGGWTRIDKRWNVMLPVTETQLERSFDSAREHRRAVGRLIGEARILHFAGPRKPWDPGYWGGPGREFRRRLYRSGWFHSGPERAVWRLSYLARTLLDVRQWGGRLAGKLAERWPRR